MRNIQKDFRKFALDKGVHRSSLDAMENIVYPTVIEERSSAMRAVEMNVFSRLIQERIIFLSGEVTSDSMDIISAQLLYLDSVDNRDINLYINSPGGDCYSGLELVSVMDFIKSDVSTTVLGMAASMGSAVFLIAEGGATLTGAFTSGPAAWIIVAVLIVGAFVISAVSGVMKGIRILSTWNSRIYFALGAFVFVFGPTVFCLSNTVEGFGDYLTNFAKISLFHSVADGDAWAAWWPVFYWCNWMAWMPVTSTFLGRLSKGYTVREAIQVIVIWPALFSVGWLGLFSSASLYYEMNGAGINEAMTNNGTAAATYAVLQQMPISVITIAVFLVIVFLAIVTASDSNTNAMAGLCTGGLTQDDQESPTWLKVVWGATIGVMCIIFILAFQSTDALKYLSNLGGFPVVFLLIIIVFSFAKVIRNPYKYDLHKEDYDEHGQPIPSVRLKSEQEEMMEAKKKVAAAPAAAPAAAAEEAPAKGNVPPLYTSNSFMKH